MKVQNAEKNIDVGVLLEHMKTKNQASILIWKVVYIIVLAVVQKETLQHLLQKWKVLVTERLGKS